MEGFKRYWVFAYETDGWSGFESVVGRFETIDEAKAIVGTPVVCFGSWSQSCGSCRPYVFDCYEIVDVLEGKLIHQFIACGKEYRDEENTVKLDWRVP